MASWTFVSRDPDETRAIARELGRAIGADGAVLALIGPLGAGKTVFVKGLAEGLGVDPRGVSSPTFDSRAAPSTASGSSSSSCGSIISTISSTLCLEHHLSDLYTRSANFELDRSRSIAK